MNCGWTFWKFNMLCSKLTRDALDVCYGITSNVTEPEDGVSVMIFLGKNLNFSRFITISVIVFQGKVKILVFKTAENHKNNGNPQ